MGGTRDGILCTWFFRSADPCAVKERCITAPPPNPLNPLRNPNVRKAYEVLSDSDKRSRYDQFGHAGVDPNNAGPGGGPGGGGDPFGGFGVRVG